MPCRAVPLWAMTWTRGAAASCPILYPPLSFSWKSRVPSESESAAAPLAGRCRRSRERPRDAPAPGMPLRSLAGLSIIKINYKRSNVIINYKTEPKAERGTSGAQGVSRTRCSWGFPGLETPGPRPDVYFNSSYPGYLGL